MSSKFLKILSMTQQKTCRYAALRWHLHPRYYIRDTGCPGQGSECHSSFMRSTGKAVAAAHLPQAAAPGFWLVGLDALQVHVGRQHRRLPLPGRSVEQARAPRTACRHAQHLRGGRGLHAPHHHRAHRPAPRRTRPVSLHLAVDRLGVSTVSYVKTT